MGFLGPKSADRTKRRNEQLEWLTRNRPNVSPGDRYPEGWDSDRMSEENRRIRREGLKWSEREAHDYFRSGKSKKKPIKRKKKLGIGNMNSIKFMGEKIQNISIIDWALVKLVSVLFGIGLIALYPDAISWMDWYWWLLIALLLALPLVHVAYSPKGKIKEPGIIGRFRYAKKHANILLWPCTKIANIFLGIAVVVLYPAMITWFDWYWWFVAVLILSIPPAYFVLYYPKATEKHPTRFSKARKKYTRTTEPYRYVKEIPEDDNSYRYQRKKINTKKPKKKGKKK